MRKITYLIFLSLLAASASGASLTVEIIDSQGDRLNSQLTLKQDGSTVADSSGYIDTNVNNGENYTLIQKIDRGPNVTIQNFSINQNLDLKPTIYFKQSPQEDFLTDTDPLYYIKQNFNFSKAQIETERSQEPDSIAR